MGCSGDRRIGRNGHDGGMFVVSISAPTVWTEMLEARFEDSNRWLDGV